MNVALTRKTLRDMLPLLLIAAAGIVLFEILFMRALGEVPEELGQRWLQWPVFRRFARVLLGADFPDKISATTIITLGFVHPLVYAMTWALLLTTCTRVIVGEIDRGTADLLLALPISRARLYVSASAAWIAAGALIGVAPLCGVWLGEKCFPLWEPLYLPPLARVTANFFALYLAVGGLTMCVSSFLSRRGPAIALVLATLLLSFLLNFLAQFWKAVEQIGFLGLLHYYRPLATLRDGQWPVQDMAALVGLAVFFWSVGLWRFRRRDIPAV